MPWIEGIGDEVTVTVVILIAMIVLLVAWLSTGIRDIPFISVIIVQLTRRRNVQNHGENTSQPENSSPTEINSDIVSNTGTTETSENVSEESPSEPPVAGFIDRSIPVAANLPNETEAEVSESKGANIGENETKEIDDINDGVHVSNVDNEDPAPCPVTSSELRQRRLNFFSGGSSEKSSSDNVTVTQSHENGCEKSNETVTESEKASTSETVSSNPPMPSRLSKLASNLLSGNLQQTSDNRISTDGSQLNANTVNDSNEQTGNQSQTGSTTDNQSQTGGPELESGEIRVRIKFLNDTQRLVTAPSTETIGNFRRRHFSTELSQSKLVRFIFNGQDLRNDSSTLESYNICDNSVLHCLVTQPPAEQPNRQHSDEDGLDIGVFMFPLFGLLLGIIWYMRFMYRQFFNVTSTLTLGGITFLYIAALMSSLRGRRPHDHIE